METPNYFNYEPRFNGVFSRNNLPRIKDGAYVTNLDDNNSKWTHLASLFIDRMATVYFDSFGIEYVPLQVLHKIRDKSITHNRFRIKDITVLASKNICMQGKLCLIILVQFLRMTIKRMTK